MTKYKIPSLTTDIFIFDDDFNFILIKRKNNPYKDYWALPGGFVEYGESVENADPRGHAISIAFTAKGDFASRRADDDASDIDIFSPEQLCEIDLAFDHEKIVKDCLKKAKNGK